jgi:hypothetical protein
MNNKSGSCFFSSLFLIIPIQTTKNKFFIFLFYKESNIKHLKEEQAEVRKWNGTTVVMIIMLRQRKKGNTWMLCTHPLVHGTTKT